MKTDTNPVLEKKQVDDETIDHITRITSEILDRLSCLREYLETCSSKNVEVQKAIHSDLQKMLEILGGCREKIERTGGDMFAEMRAIRFDFSTNTDSIKKAIEDARGDLKVSLANLGTEISQLQANTRFLSGESWQSAMVGIREISTLYKFLNFIPIWVRALLIFAVLSVFIENGALLAILFFGSDSKEFVSLVTKSLLKVIQIVK